MRRVLLLGALLAVLVTNPAVREAIGARHRLLATAGGVVAVAVLPFLTGPSGFYFYGGALLFGLELRSVLGPALTVSFAKLVVLPALTVALILTWSADTGQVLVLASKAFAFYYGLQCLVAVLISSDMRVRIGAGLLASIMFAIAAFAIPVG